MGEVVGGDGEVFLLLDHERDCGAVWEEEERGRVFKGRAGRVRMKYDRCARHS